MSLKVRKTSEKYRKRKLYSLYRNKKANVKEWAANTADSDASVNPFTGDRISSTLH